MEDLGFLKELRSDPTTWMNLGNIKMPTDYSQKEWLKFIEVDPSKRYFIAYRGEEKVGLVRCDEIDHLNRSIRVGADVICSMRGQGIGSQIYDLLLKYCFDFLNMHRVWLSVLETNTNAERLYKRKGFLVEGKLRSAIFRDGRYIDYILMSILEDEYRQLIYIK